MKCILNSCCLVLNVRQGTVVVGWLFFIFSFLYLFGYLLGVRPITRPGSTDICQQLINKYNEPLSLTGASLGVATGIVVLVAVYSENPFFLAIGIGLLSLNIMIFIFFTFWLIQCFALFIALFIASGSYIYVLVLFVSNYFDIRRGSMYIIEESPRPSLEQPFRLR